MRISRVEAIPVEIPLRAERRMISALGHHDVSRFVLVKVTSECGLTGVGEATVTPRWSGETVWGAAAMIEHVLAPAILDCDPRDRTMIDSRMDAVAVDNWFSKSAIEMACWDLEGQKKQQPVFEILGGACRPLEIRNRFSLGAYAPEVAAERAVERVEAGFQTIKVKVGTDPTVDIERVRAVRQAVGPDIELTIDANGGWTENDALNCLAAMEDCDIAIVEQPLERGNYAGVLRLKSKTGCRILADESCFDEIEAVELLERRCCDAITVYPGKHGGIAKARRIAELAAEHDIPCTIGSNLEWDVGASAMMHFIVSTPNVQIERLPGDCLGPSYHEFSIVRNPLRIEGPFTELSSRPGLGVDVDWELVEKHRF